MNMFRNCVSALRNQQSQSINRGDVVTEVVFTQTKEVNIVIPLYLWNTQSLFLNKAHWGYPAGAKNVIRKKLFPFNVLLRCSHWQS